MAISVYTDIITLDRAKTYLRVDDTMNDDDSEIISMIKGAFQFIERCTNHIFVQRSFTQYSNGYVGGCGAVTVYRYPVILTTPATIPIIRKTELKCIYGIGELTYLAGYDDISDIPDDFIQAALQIIKVWYFEAENKVNETLIPVSVIQVLDTYRRFI